MGDLGQLLRQAREQKRLSLEEIEEATNIRQKFLQALEEENFGALPAETYVKGFLRTYAIHLELDPKEVLALYEGWEKEDKAALPQPGFFQPMDISMAAPSWLTPDLVIGTLLIIILIAFGSWATWRYLPPTIKIQLPFWRPAATATPSPTATATTPTVLPSATPTVVSTTIPTGTPTVTPTTLPTDTPTALPTMAIAVEPATTTLPTPTPTPIDVATSVPTSTPTDTPTDTPTPRVSEGVEVELNIVEYAWLRVLVDGAEAFVGSLEAGTTQTWRGRESVALRCGNAGGVEAIVNGESVGLLGERGQVVDMEWFAEGITPTPPTSTPSA